MAGKRRGNGEGSIGEVPGRGWCARLSLPGGKRKARYFKTRAEAARWLALAIRARDESIAALDCFSWSWWGCGFAISTVPRPQRATGRCVADGKHLEGGRPEPVGEGKRVPPLVARTAWVSLRQQSYLRGRRSRAVR
jgi:hypothetical protein